LNSECELKTRTSCCGYCDRECWSEIDVGVPSNIKCTGLLVAPVNVAAAAHSNLTSEAQRNPAGNRATSTTSRDIVTWYDAENSRYFTAESELFSASTPRRRGYHANEPGFTDSVLSVRRRTTTTRCDTVLLAMSEVDCLAQQISRFGIELASIYRLSVIESIYECRQRLSAANSGPNYQLLIAEPLQKVSRRL